VTAEPYRKRSLIFLGLAVAGASFAMAVQGGLNTNFLVDEIGIDASQQGFLEAARETCGITALFILAALAGLAEPLVAAGMLLLVAAGLSAYAFAHEYWIIVCLSLVWSQGLHIWMPLPNSMTLALAEPGRAGHRLGQIARAGSAGVAVGLSVAFLMTYNNVSLRSILLAVGGNDPGDAPWLTSTLRPLYLLAGVAGVGGALACLGIYRRLKTPGPRLVFRRKYGLYYLLCFLEGWRKQIFICFASFLLVKVHHTTVQQMLILGGITQVIGSVASPRVGKLIDRIGERRVLVFYYSTIILVFLGYAWIPNVWVLYSLFILDSVLFMSAMALTTYVNRIAPKNEHTQTLSMGIAMNHVAAVAMPALGGLVWKYTDYPWTFMVGAAAAVLSLVVTFRIPPHTVPEAVA
jgi:predicted MFS family arabinose efflux permease